MSLNAGTTKLKPIITTNFKIPVIKPTLHQKKLKQVEQFITQQKQRASRQTVSIAKLKKSSKRKCLENCGRNRSKDKTRCATCLRQWDVGYWGKKAWEAFARYLKAYRVTFEGYFTCYTCDKTFTIDLAQAGHCFHRGNQHYKALDFDEKHIHLQCGGCNMDSQGNKQNVFQAKLTREIGVEAVERMIWRRNNEPALTILELRTMLEFYKVNLASITLQ